MKATTAVKGNPLSIDFMGGAVGDVINDIDGLFGDEDEPKDLWHAKLFRTAGSMQESFAKTLDMVSQETRLLCLQYESGKPLE